MTKCKSSGVLWSKHLGMVILMQWWSVPDYFSPVFFLPTIHPRIFHPQDTTPQCQNNIHPWIIQSWVILSPDATSQFAEKSKSGLVCTAIKISQQIKTTKIKSTKQSNFLLHRYQSCNVPKSQPKKTTTNKVRNHPIFCIRATDHRYQDKILI